MGEVVHCDVEDQSQLAQCFAQAKPEVVFNLAAAPRENSLPGSAQQWAVTATGAINLAYQCVRSQTALFMQMGSSEEYGNGEIPFLETQADKPISPYSVAKVSATRSLLISHDLFGLPVIIVRPTVVYGPGQTGEMLLPHMIRHYCAGERPALTPCAQQRDFVYIDDLISALLALGGRPELAGNIFNISQGESIELKKVAAMTANLCHYAGDLGIGERQYRLNEVMNHCADHGKISAMIGWQPTVDLEVGVTRMIDWWRQRDERSTCP
jgi:nucleoside-diphosphate-sugar epimerase